MMSTTHDNTNIDELFALWHEDRLTPNPKPLKEWMAAHPQYAGEFALWAADIPVLAWAEQQPENVANTLRTLEIGRYVLAQMRARSATQVGFSDLYKAAAAQNLKPRALAAQLGLSVDLVAKLQHRLLQVATIPESLVKRLADTLQVSREAIWDYLRQPPALASSARFKSAEVPQAGPQEAFADAIRACEDMTEDARTYWLNAD